MYILFTTELEAAAKLVNSNGGDWGYVIIPIQAGDMSKAKWQQFMDDAKGRHVIPVLRLATEGDSAEVVDMSFADQALAVEFFVKNKGKLENKVHLLP